MRDFCAVCGNIDKLAPGWDLRVLVRETGKTIDIHRRCFDKARHVIADDQAKTA